MSKGKYSARKIKHVNVNALKAKFAQKELVLATDIAKINMYTAFTSSDGEVEVIVHWVHPSELETLVALVQDIAPAKVIKLLESSGTYGEPLRARAHALGWEVRMVAAKRVHDAAELYDGVPSMHDAKAATLIARLHAMGLSKPWEAMAEDERGLRAYTRELERYQAQMRPLIGRLEADLASFWPELDQLMDKGRASTLALLEEFGGPQGVCDAPEAARALLERVGGPLLKPEKIDALLQAARHTVGKPMHPAEREVMQRLAAEMGELRRQIAWAERQVREAGQQHEPVKHVSEVVGMCTAAVLHDQLGDLGAYESAEALIKASGLNLVEKSSGTRQGALSISKRGASKVRFYLWWAAMRKIKEDPVFRAWHRRKRERDGGLGMKSVAALMRKLLKGLWHVAQGKPFDSTKLFDIRRLGLERVEGVVQVTAESA